MPRKFTALFIGRLCRAGPRPARPRSGGGASFYARVRRSVRTASWRGRQLRGERLRAGEPARETGAALPVGGDVQSARQAQALERAPRAIPRGHVLALDRERPRLIARAEPKLVHGEP